MTGIIALEAVGTLLRAIIVVLQPAMAEGAETVPDVAEGGPPEAPVQDAAGETDNTAAEATIEAENAAGEATGAAEILVETVNCQVLASYLQSVHRT